jgi:hypothetical protein
MLVVPSQELGSGSAHPENMITLEQIHAVTHKGDFPSKEQALRQI